LQENRTKSTLALTNPPTCVNLLSLNYSLGALMSIKYVRQSLDLAGGKVEASLRKISASENRIYIHLYFICHLNMVMMLRIMWHTLEQLTE